MGEERGHLAVLARWVAGHRHPIVHTQFDRTRRWPVIVAVVAASLAWVGPLSVPASASPPRHAESQFAYSSGTSRLDRTLRSWRNRRRNAERKAKS